MAAVLWHLVVLAVRSPLSTDELMARVSAQTPSFLQMLHLLRVQPVNVDAPAFPVLAYLSARLPLPIDLAIRLPAMAAMAMVILAVFFFVRDQLGFGAACIAALLAGSSSYALYGARARPYAFLLAGVAMALLSWQRASEGGRNRRFWLAALGLSSSFALLSHYFAIVYVLAILGAEAFRSLKIHKIDWLVWGALGASILVFVPVYLILTPAAQPYRAHPFDVLSRVDLAETYRDTANLHAIVITLVVTVGLTAVMGRAKHYRPLSIYASAAAVLLLLGPVLLYGAGIFYTHTYAVRYGICGVLGVTFLLSALLQAIAGGRNRVLLTAFVLAFVTNQVYWIHVSRAPIDPPDSQWAKATPKLLKRFPNLPVVTPDFDYWMRTKYYAPLWLSSKLTMVANPGSMLRVKGSENPALAALAIHRWTGWPLEDYYGFVRLHREFLMYGQYWMWDALQADGAEIQFLDYVGPYRLYRVVLPPISRRLN